MAQVPSEPPSNLPESFSEIWRAVTEADRETPNRQQLARRLGVSTATLQRLLASGDVPRLDAAGSRRERHAWVRTVTRLAVALGHEPRRWLEAIGISWEPPIAAISERARQRFLDRPGATPTTATAGDLRRELRTALAEMVEASPFVVARASRRIARETLPATWRRPAPAPARRGHCRSCLADLDDPHNHGPASCFCRWCSDEHGRLRPRAEVHGILATWLAELSGGLDELEARRRAALYMQAMPAWSDPAAAGR